MINNLVSDDMDLLGKKNRVLMLILAVLSLLVLGSATTVSADTVEDSLPLNEVGWIVLFVCIVAIVSAIYFVMNPQKKEKKVLPYVAVGFIVAIVLTVIFWLVDLASYGSIGIAWWNWIGLTFWGWMLLLLGTMLIFVCGTIANYTLIKDSDEKVATIAMLVAAVLWWVIIYICSLYITYAPLFA